MTTRRKYGLFGFWIATILAFIVSMQFFLTGFQESLPVIHTIIDRDIDSSALFYTESDIPIRAERKLGKVIRVKRKEIRPDE